METLFYNVGGGHDNQMIGRAAHIIMRGGLVAFPTETVYGLGCNAYDGEAALRVFKAKGRPADNPLIVHVAEPHDAYAFAEPTPMYDKLAERFMPGPLTVVLPKKDIIPDEVTAGNDTVAVRCPSDPTAHALIKSAGCPIAAPSANRSGSPSPTTADHVFDDLDGRIDMILDGGPCTIGLESTVIKLDGENCTILRPGAITKEMLEEVCGTVSVAKAVIDPSAVKDGNVPSPGMKYKHYAPRAEVVLVSADREKFLAYVSETASSGDAVMCAEEDMPAVRSDLICLPMGHADRPEEASQRLYAALRTSDDRRAAHVFVRKPGTDGVELAMYNRLIRAAECKITEI